VNSCNLVAVKAFRYLGRMLDETASTVVDVNRRVAIGQSGVRQVARCLMCHELTLCQRNALVQMHVIAATIYGCETWQLTDAMRSRIATVQTTALRLTTHSPLTCTTRPTTTTEQLAGIEMIDDEAPIFELAAALAEKEVKEYRHRPNAELFRVTGAKPVLDQIRAPRELVSPWTCTADGFSLIFRFNVLLSECVVWLSVCSSTVPSSSSEDSAVVPLNAPERDNTSSRANLAGAAPLVSTVAGLAFPCRRLKVLLSACCES
jgi:hypothetical protein